jgi:hypothetical protein
MTASYVDPFAVEGVEAPAAQGSAAGAGEEPDPEWQPL